MTQLLQPKRQRVVNVVADNIEKAMRPASIRDLPRNLALRRAQIDDGKLRHGNLLCIKFMFLQLMIENRAPRANRCSRAQEGRRV